MGLVPVRKGGIVFDGTQLARCAPHEIPRLGIGYVPQGRRLFAELTVRENLEIGLMTRHSGPAVLDHVLAFLLGAPNQPAGTLSGGEQQMLATARALCIDPGLLLLDEPTADASMIARIRESVLELKSHGVTTILVEQRVDAVLPVASRVAFVENGRVTAIMPVAELAADRHMIDRYVGIGH
jgi:branched-chain amino acid transport system ATP-binding protein